MITEKEVESLLSKQLQKDTSYITSLLKYLCETIQSSVNINREVPIPGLGTFIPATTDGKPMPTIEKTDLVKDIADRLLETRLEVAENAIKAFSDICREYLFKGDKIAISNLGTFELKSQRPTVEKTPKGHNIIRPGSTIIEFTPKLMSGIGSMLFLPDDQIKEQLRKIKKSTVLLAIPTRDFFVDTLNYYFTKAGWEVTFVQDAKSALSHVKSNGVSLLILDASMHDHIEITKEVKTKKGFSHIPLIVLYPTQQVLKTPSDLTIVGDVNLAQPFEVRKLLQEAEREVLRAAEEGLFIKQTLNLIIPSDERCMEKSSEIINKILEESGLDDEKQVALSTAFREAQLNAFQHGNKFKKTLPVEIQYILDSTKVSIVVTDQGTGFDFNFYLATGKTRDAVQTARIRRAQGRMGGLGIMLMIRCTDELHYNKTGNQLTLVKYLKKPSN